MPRLLALAGNDQMPAGPRRAVVGKRFVWLTGADVPRIELKDGWYSIYDAPV